MVKSMDVVVESFRPGVMERLGLGPKEIHEANPNTIYVRLSGYGQSDTAVGHDSNYLAKSGLLSRFTSVADG